MGNLQPNLLAIRHSHALRGLKKEHPGQVDLLVSKHNPGETVTAQKQATGTYQKNTEHLLGIITRPTTGASSKQPASQKNSEHLLAICSLS